MNKDNDFTCKKWVIVIDPNFKKKLKKYKCTLCNEKISGEKEVLKHLNFFHGCKIEWKMPPDAALRLALKRDKSKLKNIQK